MRTRLAVLAITAAALIVGDGSPALAGGSHIGFEREWYMPGDDARATGTISVTNAAGRGWIGDGPYQAFLVDHATYEATYGVHPAFDPNELLAIRAVAVPVGPLYTRPTSLALTSVAVEFEIPDLPAGRYVLFHCNEGCDKQLGDLMDGRLWIGGPPPPSTTAPPPTVPPPTTAAPELAHAVAPRTHAIADRDDGSRDVVPWIGATALVGALALTAGALELVARRRRA